MLSLDKNFGKIDWEETGILETGGCILSPEIVMSVE
jgi:hypothetical protein